MKDYDDDRTAGKIRYLAGLNPTIIGNQNKTVRAYLQQKKQSDKDNFLLDVEGVAHTFAAVYKGNDYQRVDEASPGGGNFSQYNNKVLAIWK